MILNTYLEKTAAFWKERGIVPKARYHLNGVTTWTMDIPDKHADLKHPDFISLQAEEIIAALPQIIKRRLKPPVFTLKVGRLFADIVDKMGKKGLPISHSRAVLAKMCAQSPNSADIVKLNSDKRIARVLTKAQQQGTKNIFFFPSPGITETIPIAIAFHALGENPK